MKSIGAVNWKRPFFTFGGVAILIAFCLCAANPVLMAQNAGTGAIAGTVTDPSGKAVPDTKITVMNEGTSVTLVVKSQNSGAYTAPLLLPGTYKVEAAKEGFKTWVGTGVRVNVTETTGLNIKLEVGAVAVKVTVTGAGSVLQTESSTLGSVTDSRMIENLPLATRNYTQIIGLNPGVATDIARADSLGRGDDAGSNQAGGAGVVSNGSRGADNNVQMDGVEINDRQQSGLFSGGVAIPNPDSIQEFRVQTSQYDASFGRDTGANVDVQTKGGTNQFHGNAWEYFRNTAMNANDWFFNRAGLPTAVDNQNQYGGDVGGPVIKDKLFFFGSYQGTRQKNGLFSYCQSSTTGLQGLTDADRTSAAALGAAFAGQSGSAGSQALDTIQANGSNISPQALAILQLKVNGQYLLPSQGNAQSLVFSVPCPYTEEQFIANMDYVQSNKSKFSGRFFFANDTTTWSFPGDLSSVPGTPFPQKDHYRNFSLAHDYAFSSNVSNHAVFGFHRTLGQSAGTSVYTLTGIGATLSPALLANNNAYVNLGIDTTDLDEAPLGGISTNIAENTYAGEDTLSYLSGRHYFRFGGGVVREDESNAINDGAALDFQTFPDFLLGLSSAGNGSNVPGGLNSSNIGQESDAAGGSVPHKLVSWDFNAYVQDDFKATSRLTFNLGFRYDRDGYQGDTSGHNTGFNPSLIAPYSLPATSCMGGSLLGYLVSSNYPAALPSGGCAGMVTQLNNTFGFYNPGIRNNTWNPRLGFAWRLPYTERIVLRGGYGIYHADLNGQAIQRAGAGLPFVYMQRLLGPSVANQSWANPFPAFTTTLPAFVPYEYVPLNPAEETSNSASSVDPNYRPAMIQEYSLGIQAELARDLVLSVGYSGARGLHVLNTSTINQACLVGVSLSVTDACSGPLQSGTTINNSKNAASRVPYLGFAPALQGIQMIQSNGAYWYNALLASLTKRFSHGLQFQLSYTWSKELDTTENTSSNNGGGVMFGDQNHPLYGPDSYIRPQRFVASYVYSLPGPKDLHSLSGELLGGWQLSGVTTYQAGHFLTPTAQVRDSLFGAGTVTPSLGPGCTLASLQPTGSIQSRVNSYFPNAATCLAVPELTSAQLIALNAAGPASGFGNLGVGYLRGPDQANWDMSLGKHFPISWPNGGGNIEFRADFFNAFNHPQFSDPRLITALPRPSAAFNTISTTSVNPRIIQLALRFNF